MLEVHYRSYFFVMFGSLFNILYLSENTFSENSFLGPLKYLTKSTDLFNL